ncbi:MAG: hypothetical protein GC161_02520 [Planctomycetaceae bacterium]|nr:hypothetical protein [Planctomycetaceae bacterium]
MKQTAPFPAVLVAPFLAALAALPALAAGDVEGADPDALEFSSAHIATSLGHGQGGLEGHGPDFRAFWTSGGMRYEPALGRRAANLQHLELATRSLGREFGADLLVGVRPAPQAIGDRAVYAIGQAVEERWDVRPEGVEFSYSLEARPEGEGDLVAKLALATELPFAGVRADGGLTFELPGVGGVSIGAALGIDATGRTVPAAMHYRDGELELRLSAQFVDSAVYPIVLDPLVGTVISVENEPVPNRRPDVAFDVSSARYLAVWDREFSASLSVILARRLNSGGNPVGSVISFPGGSLARKPRVANSNAANHFIVVYEFESGPHRILARTVRASDGALGPVGPTIATSTEGELLDPDVGGQSVADASLPAAVLVVWRDDVEGEILARRLLVSGDGSLEAPDAPVVVTSDTIFADNTAPRISATTAGLDRHLIVWQQDSSLVGVGSTIRGRVVGTDGQFKSSSQTIASVPEVELSSPDVDGLDSNWVVAFERRPGGGGVGISARRVTYNGLFANFGTSPIVDLTSAALLFTATRPTVAWTPQKSWVAWRQSALLVGWTLRIAGINSIDCSVCETSQQVVALGGGENAYLSVTTTASGGSTTGFNGLLVWSAGDGVAPTIFAQGLALDANGGSAVNLGGGCGAGGTASANQNPAIGTSNFQLQLTGTIPSAPFTILNLNSSIFLFQCGPCALLPLATTVVLPVNSSGVANFSAAIPCTLGLVGNSIDAQWITLTPGLAPCPSSAGFSASNRLRLTFGL